MPTPHAQWPLPQGVVDLLFEDAAGKRDLEQRLRRIFSAWSYDELIPPTFEYADTLASEAGTQLAEEMYRFVDRDGRTLALRPDLTIPTARVVGTRLYDQPLPLRLFYIGSVFRYEPPQAGRQREFTQAGFELIGAATPAADAEALALTVEALQAAGLRGFQIALGQMAFFRGLLAELNAPPLAVAALQSAIDRKNPADLATVLDKLLSQRDDAYWPGALGGDPVASCGIRCRRFDHLRPGRDARYGLLYGDYFQGLCSWIGLFDLFGWALRRPGGALWPGATGRGLRALARSHVACQTAPRRTPSSGAFRLVDCCRWLRSTPETGFAASPPRFASRVGRQWLSE